MFPPVGNAHTPTGRRLRSSGDFAKGVPDHRGGGITFNPSSFRRHPWIHASLRRPPARLSTHAAAWAFRRRVALYIRPCAAPLWVLQLDAEADQSVAAADVIERRGGGPRHDPSRDRTRAVPPQGRSWSAVAGDVSGDRGEAQALLQRRRRGQPATSSGAISIWLRAVRVVG